MRQLVIHIVVLLIALRGSTSWLIGQHSNIRTPCSIGIGPSLDSIPRNVAVLMETCGCDETLLAELGKGEAVWLVSTTGDSVPLRRIEYHKMVQEQVLLGTGRHLKAGERYHLAASRLQDLPHVDWPEGLSWPVKNVICESQVGYYASPKIDHKIKGEMNGAILAVVGFAFKPLDSTEYYWTRITATDDWTGDEAQWLMALPPKQTGIEVGYPLRPCGPMPVLGFENEYRVVITLIGVDGAEGRSSEPIRIAP